MHRPDILVAENLLSKASTMQSTPFSAEWQVLIAFASLDWSAERLKHTLRGPLDWPALLAQAEEHSVLPLVAARLRELSPRALSPEIEAKLHSWQRAQAVFTLTLTAELFQVLERFAVLDIAALVTKGPALSVRCYGDPGIRQYCDLDLIVRDADMRRVTEAMIALGYAPKVPLSAIQTSKFPGEYAFRKLGTELLVEFHTERTFRYHPQRLPIETLFARSSSVTIDSRAVPALAIEDELVLICIHGAKHFWERLMWIADVAALVSKQTIDWSRAMAAARAVQAERMLQIGLLLAKNMLDVRLPPEIASYGRSDATAHPPPPKIPRGRPL